VLLDPAPKDVIAAFERVGRSAAAAGGDVLFLFYYSGHSDGQSLFPHGEPMALSDLRSRVERLGARIRVGILDTCRGGSWTQSKGLTVGPPLRMADLMNVDTEGTALVSSSSGLENAHEAAEVHGSFFTHYLTAGLRGAADRAGDGNVTLEEAFDYAKERTVRDSARIATTPQHPSFDLALRGRHDIVLTVMSPGTSALQLNGAHASLEVIHLPSGVTVADAPNGDKPLHIALPPGRYLVRSVVDGHVYAKEVEVRAGQTATLAAGQLEATGHEQLAMKGPHAPRARTDADSDADADADPDADADAERAGSDAAHAEEDAKRARADAHRAPRAETPRDKDHEHEGWSWKFPSCNDPDPDPEGKVRVSTGCAGVFGLRGSVVDTRGGDGTRAGLEVAADSEEYWRHGVMSSVWRYQLALGGGGAGLEGALAGALAFGLRGPVTDHQGPVIRAGVQAYVLGNDSFYSSLLELPQLQAGWQWSRGYAVLEAAATTGVALTGRFRAGAAQSRELAGFAYGGHVSAQVPWVRLSALLERLPGDDGLGGVDMAGGTLCLVTSPVAVCGDVRAEQADARLAGAETRVRAIYGGITLGLTGEH
jgi:Caspase domain